VAALLASGVGTAAMWLVGTRLGSVDIAGLIATTADQVVVDAPLKVSMPGMFVMWSVGSAVVITILAMSDWISETQQRRHSG
jgi:hypothetical protein